jgi:RNA polymerase sigma factor (sigma-70 family)
MSPSVSVRLLLTQSDERLVEYARAGHERAFEALVQRYRRQLLGYCRRLLLADERAEDALQQALLQAWVALRDGTEVRDVRPWLYRIVHNAAVNALRVSGYDYCKLSESLSGAGAPQDDLDRRIAVREALAGLATLPQMQREALLRTAVEGRSHQQVASDLGVSEPALRGLVYRARATMRAAAGAIVPPPLLGWALEAGTRGAPALERVASLGAGGGSAGLAGLLVKGGAVAVTAGALAGGLVATHERKATARPAAHVSVRAAAPATTPDQGASVQPAAFARPSGHDTTGGGGRLPAGARMRRPFAPIPILIGERHSHRDRSGLAGAQSGGSGRSRSRDGHGESSGVSGPGPGEGEQKGGGGTSLDGGGSTSSGKDGSGDSLSAQPSGGGESSSSGGGGSSSSSTKDGSGDSQLSEPTSGDSSSISTSDSKDGAGITEPSKSG